MKRTVVVLLVLLGVMLATPAIPATSAGTPNHERAGRDARATREERNRRSIPPLVEESIRRLGLRFVAQADGSLTADPGAYLATFADGRLTFHVRGADGRPRVGLPFVYELDGLFAGEGRIEGRGSTVAVRHADDWLELERSEMLVERYEVRESGVKQSFLLLAPPSPIEGDLEIRGTLETPLRADVTTAEPGQPLEFLDGTEPVVRVGRVLIRDTAGRELLGRLRVEETRLSILVEGAWLAEASYPVEIDPLIGTTLPISNDGRFHDPDVSYNRTNDHYLVVYEREPTLGEGGDIFASLLDGRGEVLNETIWIRWGTNDQRRPTVSWASSTNRWVACWQDGGSLGLEWDIECKVITPDGIYPDPGTVFTVDENNVSQRRPDVACGTQDCFLVWEHETPVLFDGNVYGARISTQSASVAGYFVIEGGLVISTARPSIAHRPAADQYMVVYQVSLFGEVDIEAVVLDNTGSITDTCTIAQVPGLELDPEVAFSEEADHYLIAWERGPDLYAQLQNAACGVHVEEFLVRDETHDVVDVRVAGGSPDKCFAVASQVNLLGQPNVLLQTVCDDGTIRETITLPVELQYYSSLAIAYNDFENEYLLVWADYLDSPSIGAQRYATTLCPDADDDGYAVCDPVCKLHPGDHCDDCDDGDATVHPFAAELCDGKDNDCNFQPGPDEVDHDSDGFFVCDGDCDDGNGDRYPGAPEICDGLDSDCDGDIPPDEIDGDGDNWSVCEGDCDDTNDRLHPGRPEHCGNWRDDDCDGIIDCFDGDCYKEPTCECIDFDQDIYVDCSRGCRPIPPERCGDCNDFDPDVNPLADEDCGNGRDDDCNDRIDAEDPACSPVCPDPDGDSWVVCQGGCVPDIGLECGDCDEGSPDVNPGVTEDCQAAGDEDCDGLANIADPDCTACPDQDTDDWAVCGPDCALEVGDTCGDCNDIEGEIYPGAPEQCNEVDDDCDGQVPLDEIDDDDDGWSECQGDCDDTEPLTHSGAPEECDREDNDCDGDVPWDEIDHDGDGWTQCEGDCEEGEPEVYPGAPEICDGFDNDCSGSLPASETDHDTDGYTPCDGDCDDDDPSLNPGRDETASGYCRDDIDNDCDGLTDCWDDGCSGWSWCVCRDGDGDGWVDCENGCTPEAPELQCGDCDDAVFDTNPGETEDCAGGQDDDCDGLTDEDDPDCWPPCRDNDNDGWSSCHEPCIPDEGDQCGDCLDWDPEIHPGVPDDTCDGQDNDCDELYDEDVVPPSGSITLMFDTPYQISWNPVPDATGYRIVRGNTIVLRQTAGDFEQSTFDCPEPDWPETTADYWNEPGEPGECEWVLVSPVNCGGVGSFDSGGPGQQGSRDAGIEASQVCPP